MQLFFIRKFVGTLSLFFVLIFSPVWTRPAENPYSSVILAKDISRDEAMEQALLDLVNQLRADPPRFYRQVVEPYLRQEGAIHVTAKYVNSLRKEILHCPSLPPFRSDDRLRHTAFLLASDIVNHQQGRLSHTMSNGMDFAARFRQAGIGCGAENLYTGLNRTPEEVLADWLIDEGVPDFGHRHNLLNPQYRSTGIVVLRNKAGQIWVVEDFGCEP